jgi:tetratricopeptide (TPR) repeat protein
LVIDRVGKMESLDHWAAGDAGWCHYRLGNYEAAERLLVEALGLKRDEPRSRTAIGLQLDLAQVVLSGGRYTLGLQQYSNALDLARDKEALVRRGLLDWSLFELEYETSQNKELAEIPQVKRVLSIMYEAAGRCCYELGDWARGERMLARALAWREGEPFSAAVAGLQFALALAMTRGGRREEGISQYERALEDATKISEPQERRDLLEQAQMDLKEASTEDEDLGASPEIQQVLSRLEEAYKEIEAELEQAGIVAEGDEEWGDIASLL